MVKIFLSIYFGKIRLKLKIPTPEIITIEDVSRIGKSLGIDVYYNEKGNYFKGD